MLPVAILRQQPRQIALISFDALLDEFGLLSSDDPLNLRCALFDESIQFWITSILCRVRGGSETTSPIPTAPL